MRRWQWCLFACMVLGCCQSAPDVPMPEDDPEISSLEVTPTPAEAPQAELDKLARTDPIAFLQRCRDNTAREVHSYRGTLLMHERVQGKVSPPERIAFAFRDKPYAIRMEWKEGVKLARKTLYVEGENDGHMLIQLAGWRSLAGIVKRRPDSEDATSSSRMPITEFGMQMGIERSLVAWKAAHKRGELDVTVGGLKKVRELGDHPVLEVKRNSYKKPEEDGIQRATFYFDLRTGLQVGTLLLDKDDRLIGKYFFRDLEFDPTFAPDTFTRDGLKK